MSAPRDDFVRDWLIRARSDLHLGRFELPQYAVQTRYPGEWEPVTKTEAEGALARASLVLAWVENRLG
jgi:HEPN domain-containing protein